MNKLAEIEAKGTRDTAQGSAPFEVLAGPGKMRIVQGETTTVVNDNKGWMKDAKGTHALRPNQIETIAQIAEAYRPTLPNQIPANAQVHQVKVDDRPADISDYREVDGVKLPFVVRVDTIDPRAGATRHYTEIRLNAKANPNAFAEPE